MNFVGEIEGFVEVCWGFRCCYFLDLFRMEFWGFRIDLLRIPEQVFLWIYGILGI